MSISKLKRYRATLQHIRLVNNPSIHPPSTFISGKLDFADSEVTVSDRQEPMLCVI